MSHVLLPSQETSSHRRHVLVFTSVSLVTNLTFNFLPLPLFAWAGEKAKGEDDKDEGVIEAVKSLFDPNEKTKSGKVLPKAYLKSARELVRTLRDSLKEDPKDLAKFRRTADAAKESIREYLNGWRGQNTVVKEVSFFYSFYEFGTCRSFTKLMVDSYSYSQSRVENYCFRYYIHAVWDDGYYDLWTFASDNMDILSFPRKN